MKTIPERRLTVSDEVADCVKLLRTRYGAVLTHDSGHATAPTLIYTFPRFNNAQIAVRMNKEKLSLYIRGANVVGIRTGDWLEGLADIKREYGPSVGSSKKPANSLLSEDDAPFLTPRRNHLLLIAPRRGALQELVDRYLDAMTSPETQTVPGSSNRHDGTFSPVSSKERNYTHRPMSAEEFQGQLDRRSEIGRIGEQKAIEFEEKRLIDLGCDDPKPLVRHVALADVGRGYDVETIWPLGEERYIEVKSSTRTGNSVLMSDNERNVLRELGKKAWLYRVVLDSDGGAEVIGLNDPISNIPSESFSTEVWRVHLPEAEE